MSNICHHSGPADSGPAFFLDHDPRPSYLVYASLQPLPYGSFRLRVDIWLQQESLILAEDRFGAGNTSCANMAWADDMNVSRVYFEERSA
jgi:hypothetical protein